MWFLRSPLQNLKVELKDDKDVLIWDAVQDTGSVRYQILRDDRYR